MYVDFNMFLKNVLLKVYHWKNNFKCFVITKIYLTKNSTKLLLRELEYYRSIYVHTYIYAQVNSRKLVHEYNWHFENTSYMNSLIINLWL